MPRIAQDLHQAARQLLRRPAYTLAVIVLMALGIAGNAAVFRLVNGLFLRPLPYDQPQQLVDLNETAPQWNLELMSIAYRDFHDWRAQNDTFLAMTVFRDSRGNLLVNGEPERVSYLETTHDIDEVLRLQPRLGRFYTPEEDHPNGPRVAMLSHGMWQQRFDARDDVLGTVITLDGRAVEIVGVLPESAKLVREAQIWLPLRQSRDDWFGWGLNGVGRLLPGVTPDQAQADLLTIHKAMIPEFELNEITFPLVEPLRDRYLGGYRLGSGFLLGAMGVVLLLACANIGGLVAVHSMGRSRELALRSALGASRGRLLRQLMTENLLLAVVGSTLGVTLGVFGSGVLVEPMAEQFPSWVSFELDGRFLGFTLALTALAALLFGLVPSLRASWTAQSQQLMMRNTPGRWLSRRMNWIVGTEVALALVLLVLGGLAMLDVARLGDVDPGFETEGVISWEINLPLSDYDRDQRSAFYERLLPELEAVPGVEAATIASTTPLSGHWGFSYLAQGAPPRPEGEANPTVLKRVVSPNYFDTLGVELVAGRLLDDFDGRDQGLQAVVVNETFVRTHLSHFEDPVGALLVEGDSIPDEPEWFQVVGVTRDVLHYGVDQEMRPGLYAPLRGQPLGRFRVALRIDSQHADVAAVARQVRAVTARVDPRLPVQGLETLQEQLDRSLWTRRAAAWLIGVFSAVALLLTVAGLYGVVSHAAGLRRREIGIRLAVGAQRREVFRHILGQGMSLVGVGVVVGLTAAFFLAQGLSAVLVGVTASEPTVYLGVTLLLVAVAALASIPPARRAASTDPATVLRRD